MEKRITIKDVAKRAGVSDTTVSRVIHNDSRISHDTKKIVRAAIEELGYQPNLVARGLVRNRTQTLALISPELHPYVQPLIRGVSDACLKHEHAMLLFAEGEYVRESEVLARVAQNWRVDGVIFYHVVKTFDSQLSEDLRRALDKMNVVFLNKYFDADNLNVVEIDNQHALDLLVDHLASLGHTRIGALTASPESLENEVRTEAFERAMERHGLSVDQDIVRCAHFMESKGYSEMKAMLEKGKPPTAVICFNDLMAFGAMAAIQEAGLVVPDDIAVVGIDNSEGSRYTSPPLTTVDMPMEEMGSLAVELLLKTLDQPTRTAEQIKLKPKLIVRPSSDPKAQIAHTDMAEERARGNLP